MKYKFAAPRHLLIGVTFDSWCGLFNIVHSGLAATREETKMSCGNCRRSLNAFRKRHPETVAKNVTPPA